MRVVHAAEHTRRLTRAALASSGSFGVRTAAAAAAAAFGVPPAELPPLRRRLLAGVSLPRLLLAARLPAAGVL